jgi:hypothetical protein
MLLLLRALRGRGFLVDSTPAPGPDLTLLESVLLREQIAPFQPGV